MYLVRIDLTLMALSDVGDAIVLHCHPIIPGPHYLSYHYVPTGMRTTDSFMNLMHDFLGLISIDTSQKYLVLTLLIKNVSVQKESHG